MGAKNNDAIIGWAFAACGKNEVQRLKPSKHN
jgi:hypothetical protein